MCLELCAKQGRDSPRNAPKQFKTWKVLCIWIVRKSYHGIICTIKGKTVVLFSTMHHTTTTEGEEDKLEIVLHYNKTKSGVDNMDHLATIFSCRRRNNRWPMVLFYNVLDVAELAALVVWISLNPDWSFSDRQGRRRKFLKQLGQKLTNDYTQIRLQTQSCLKSNVRNALKIIGKLDDLPQTTQAAENCSRNVAGCVQHRSTRKHQEYAIFATGMCALPILLKW